ncbi:MAG: SdrD B-like domain-containing protein [Blastocatellia bacterium]
MRRRTTLVWVVLASCLALLFSTPSGTLSSLQNLALKAAQAFAPLPTGAKVCGKVSVYVPATSSAAGVIRVGNLSYSIAPGAVLKGVTLWSDQCFTFCFDASGRIFMQQGDPTAGQNLSQICGMVTAFSPSQGGLSGSITIGGSKIRIAPGIRLPGQELVAPGSNTCLIVGDSGEPVGGGSSFYQNSSPKQVRVAQVVHGKIFGSNNEEDIFSLSEPMILTLDSDLATVFTVGPQTFGRQMAINAVKVEGFSFSTPNASVQAVACTDSLWDGEIQIASSGVTEGDMVTLNLLNPDKSVAQQVAMFSIQNNGQNNGVSLTKLHSDVTMKFGGNDIRGVGHFAPFSVWAGNSGYRAPGITFAFSPSSRTLNGCFQYAIEIKRAGGAGTVSVVLDTVTVKRMETANDRYASLASGLTTGSLGWFPTGKVCDFVCWACTPLPAGISGYVYCDTNKNGSRDSGEGGIANVEIKLLNASGQQTGQTARTNNDGFYQFSVNAGTYGLMETQPTGSPVTGDGQDARGNCGGDVGNDMITNIVVAQGSSCGNYNFGELCETATVKCDTLCWRSTQHWLSNYRYLPGGTVLISGVNANNPVSIQQSLSSVRQALQGGNSAMQRINKEYVTAQISMAASGGSGSPVVFNAFWSAISCSRVSFSPVTLSNGVTLSPSSLLDTLNTQSVLAIKQNRHADMFLLADIWALFNGQCGQ